MVSVHYKIRYNNHTIMWSTREKCWVIKKGTKRVYDTVSQTDIFRWIDTQSL
jgi:hypothetical protein